MFKPDKQYSVIKPAHGYFKGSVEQTDISPTIDTGVGKWHTIIGEKDVSSCKCVGLLQGDGYESTRRVYSPEQTCPTITTCGGGNTEVKICEPVALDEQNQRLREDGTVGTVVTDGNSPKHNNRVVEPSMKVRKQTEKECLRLMGVKDEDFEKVCKNQSMTSLYHLAGDSIITNCLMAIFKEML